MARRIVQIIPTLVRGGAEKQLSLLAAGLPKDQFDVHVVVLTHTGPLEEDLRKAEIPLTQINKRWKLDPWAYYRLKAELKRLKPDLVHTWLFAANSYGRQAAVAAGVKQVIAGERCVDPWKGSVQLMIDRRLARQTARIVTNSSGVKEFYVSKGLPADKFSIIPNGITLPAASLQPTLSREQLLAQLKLPAHARLIGAVGRLWPQKRLKDLIWGMDLLNCVRDDTHLLIVGDGPQRQSLERYAENVKITEHVHFLGERSDVPALMPHFDCLWLASSYEGQSNAIMEAMACGVPVVASDIPGNRDLVVPDQTGFIVPLGDRAAFARQTQILLADRPLAQQFGTAARQRMESEFSVPQMIARHAALYQQLIG